MPKMRTHKGSAKRFKVTPSGRIRHEKAFKSHILEKKSPKRKRSFRKSYDVNAVDVPRIRRLLAQ